jgi:acyl dehydratase
VSARFEDLDVGQELPARTRLVTREDVRAYAEASGDHNPLHQDDEVAHAAGFPRVVAHGMYTMGTLASWLAEWAGDPAALVRLQVNFRAPVLVEETIACGGRVRSLDPETRTALLEVWVTLERDGATEWPIRRSEAEVRLPRRSPS